jgi:sugar phosphate isomerase/epimerase
MPIGRGGSPASVLGGLSMSSAPPALSLQLYSLRQLGDLDAQLDSAAEAGFLYVETIGSHLDNPSALKSGLTARGLMAPTGHIGLRALRGDLSHIADSCLSCGIGQLLMPALPPEERGKTAQAWQRAGEELGVIAAKLSEKGVALGYHNHHWELDPLEGGGCGLQWLFEGANRAPGKHMSRPPSVSRQ